MNINIDVMQIRTDMTKPTQQHKHSLHDKHSNFLHFSDYGDFILLHCHDQKGEALHFESMEWWQHNLVVFVRLSVN